MRNILIFCLLFNSASAQTKYVLLERGWHRAPLYTDTILREHISKGYFPIYASELDTLLMNVSKFEKLGKQGLKRKYFNNDDFKTKTISYDIINVPHPYGDVYDINITSTTEGGVYKLKVADPSQTMYHTKIYINGFIAYLKKAIKDREKAGKSNS